MSIYSDNNYVQPYHIGIHQILLLVQLVDILSLLQLDLPWVHAKVRKFLF